MATSTTNKKMNLSWKRVAGAPRASKTAGHAYIQNEASGSAFVYLAAEKSQTLVIVSDRGVREVPYAKPCKQIIAARKNEAKGGVIEVDLLETARMLVRVTISGNSVTNVSRRELSSNCVASDNGFLLCDDNMLSQVSHFFPEDVDTASQKMLAEEATTGKEAALITTTTSTQLPVNLNIGSALSANFHGGMRRKNGSNSKKGQDEDGEKDLQDHVSSSQRHVVQIRAIKDPSGTVVDMLLLVATKTAVFAVRLEVCTHDNSCLVSGSRQLNISPHNYVVVGGNLMMSDSPSTSTTASKNITAEATLNPHTGAMLVGNKTTEGTHLTVVELGEERGSIGVWPYTRSSTSNSAKKTLIVRSCSTRTGSPMLLEVSGENFSLRNYRTGMEFLSGDDVQCDKITADGDDVDFIFGATAGAEKAENANADKEHQSNSREDRIIVATSEGVFALTVEVAGEEAEEPSFSLASLVGAGRKRTREETEEEGEKTTKRKVSKLDVAARALRSARLSAKIREKDAVAMVVKQPSLLATLVSYYRYNSDVMLTALREGLSQSEGLRWLEALARWLEYHESCGYAASGRAPEGSSSTSTSSSTTSQLPTCAALIPSAARVISMVEILIDAKFLEWCYFVPASARNFVALLEKCKLLVDKANRGSDELRVRVMPLYAELIDIMSRDCKTKADAEAKKMKNSSKRESASTSVDESNTKPLLAEAYTPHSHDKPYEIFRLEF